MERRIALLDASYSDPNTARNFRRELSGEVTAYDVVDGDLPDDFDYDAVVVSGSRASVYWDEPWIDRTREWVRRAIDRDLPVLGICWGHQLLADAIGGTVEPMGEYELGYRSVEHTGDALFAGVPEEFTVFTTHADAVTGLPPGAEPIAENDFGVHAFRYDGVVGVQSHPEYDPETAEAVVRRKEHLPEERIESVCDGIDEEAYAEAEPAKNIFDNFCAAVGVQDPVGAGDSVAADD